MTIETRSLQEGRALEVQNMGIGRTSPAMNNVSVQGKAVADSPEALPETVHFVVNTSGVLGCREHVVSSLLFESRSAALSKLQQLRAADPLKSFDIWKGTFYSDPKIWAYDVVLSSGVVMTSEGGRAPWTQKLPTSAGSAA